MDSPGKRPNDGDDGDRWRRSTRKKRRKGSKNDRKVARGKTNIPKNERKDISDKIPQGFVTGDRVFCKGEDGKQPVYSDIAEGKYGEWRRVGEDNVYWGEGDGGVWVHARRPAADVIAWEVLKMELPRLESLHIRNKKRIRDYLKPVKLPSYFEDLVKDRDGAFQRANEAKAELERQIAETEETAFSMEAALRGQEEAQSKLTEMQTLLDAKDDCGTSRQRSDDTKEELERLKAEKDEAVACSEAARQSQKEAEFKLRELRTQTAAKEAQGSSSRDIDESASDILRVTDAARRSEEYAASKVREIEACYEAKLAAVSGSRDMTVAEADSLRAARDKAVTESKKVSQAERKASMRLGEQNKNLEIDKANLQTSLDLAYEDLLQSQHDSKRMKDDHEKIAEACKQKEKELKAMRTRAERYEQSFEIEVAPPVYIDLEADNNLPSVILDVERRVKNLSWAGWDESGNSTSWLAPAFKRLLDLRSRGNPSAK